MDGLIADRLYTEANDPTTRNKCYELSVLFVKCNLEIRNPKGNYTELSSGAYIRNETWQMINIWHFLTDNNRYLLGIELINILICVHRVALMYKISVLWQFWLRYPGIKPKSPIPTSITGKKGKKKILKYKESSQPFRETNDNLNLQNIISMSFGKRESPKEEKETMRKDFSRVYFHIYFVKREIVCYCSLFWCGVIYMQVGEWMDIKALINFWEAWIFRMAADEKCTTQYRSLL